MRLHERTVIWPRRESVLKQVGPVAAFGIVDIVKSPKPIADLWNLGVSPGGEGLFAPGPAAAAADGIELAGLVDDHWVPGALDTPEHRGPAGGSFAVEAVEIDVDSRDNLAIRVARHIRQPVVELVRIVQTCDDNRIVGSGITNRRDDALCSQDRPRFLMHFRSRTTPIEIARPRGNVGLVGKVENH